MSADDKAKKSTSGASAAKPKDGTTAKAKKAKTAGAYDYRIPAGSRWAGMWKMWAAVGAVGLLLSGVGYAMDPTRFAFSYLFAFICALTVALGSLFFIIIERLTSAGWSITVRRLAEFFASGFPVLVILFLPVFMCMGTLFPWLTPGHEAKAESHEMSLIDPLIKSAHAEQENRPGQAAQGRPPVSHAIPQAVPAARPRFDTGHGRGAVAREGEALEAQDKENLVKKAGYLNRPFFIARIFLYFAVWLFIALRYFRLSTQQDVTKDPALTRQAQSFAPIATILFGLTVTFAGFDWIMSLEPHWFSTIFGVTFFAGCVVTIFATLTVLAMALRDDGLTKQAITVEHFHDLGKLLFGFLIFWAYVNFSQYMLIWYAAIPEETAFYHHRWDVGSWEYVSLLIVIAHFIVPFFLLLSRNVKRRLPALRLGAVWLLVMHVVEIYWLVMPNYNHGESSVSWLDFACLAGVVGVYLAVVFRNMTRYPLIPVGDPRLARSLHFENA
jgi:hypothetical protein